MLDEAVKKVGLAKPLVEKPASKYFSTLPGIARTNALTRYHCTGPLYAPQCSTPIPGCHRSDPGSIPCNITFFLTIVALIQDRTEASWAEQSSLPVVVMSLSVLT